MGLMALLFRREPPIKHREWLLCYDTLKGFSLVLYEAFYLGKLIYTLGTILAQTPMPALLNARAKSYIIREPCTVVTSCCKISSWLSTLVSRHNASWCAHPSIIGRPNVSTLRSETHFHYVVSGVFEKVILRSGIATPVIRASNKWTLDTSKCFRLITTDICGNGRLLG